MAKTIVTEYCPYCETENRQKWDIAKQGWEIICSGCGEALLLCDECLHAGDNPTMACPVPCLRMGRESA